MGRNRYSSRYSERSSLCIDMTWLKNRGYLSGYRSGKISWGYQWVDCTDSVSLTVRTYTQQKVDLHYSLSSDPDDENRIDYSVPLVRIPCNLGGVRWAFKCPLIIKSKYCGRTCYKLYKPPNVDYFGCRKCVRITYESQSQSNKKLAWLGTAFRTRDKIDELRESIHKSHYQGRPTKKTMRLERLESKTQY
jgi:hypothetical protein